MFLVCISRFCAAGFHANRQALIPKGIIKLQCVLYVNQYIRHLQCILQQVAEKVLFRSARHDSCILRAQRIHRVEQHNVYLSPHFNFVLRISK